MILLVVKASSSGTTEKIRSRSFFWNWRACVNINYCREACIPPPCPWASPFDIILHHQLSGFRGTQEAQFLSKLVKGRFSEVESVSPKSTFFNIQCGLNSYFISMATVLFSVFFHVVPLNSRFLKFIFMVVMVTCDVTQITQRGRGASGGSKH